MNFSLKENLNLIGSVWAAALRTIRRHPVVVAPFLVIAACEALTLTILYLAPRPPLKALFAPPIRLFYHYPGLPTGAPYLHYPNNFLLLPLLFSHAQIAIGVTVGVVMTAVAVRMIFQIKKGDRVDWLAGLKPALLRFPTLLTIWLIIFGLQLGAGRYLPRLGSSPEVRNFIFYLGLFLVVIIEVFFVYAVPAVMGEAQRAWRAMVRSFALAGSVFWPTFVITVVPLILRLGLIFLIRKNPTLIERLEFPEITLFILGGGILLSWLSEVFLRVSATVLFLARKEG